MRIFPVSKNARFTHDMANFGFVVRGKRFSAHEAADPGSGGKPCVLRIDFL